MARLDFTSPVGRLISGSVYEPRTTDAMGAPLVVKTGQNIGQPRVEFAFGVAIPKTPGVTHWASEPWGAPIWAHGHAEFPNGAASSPLFSWKITDGDSQIPNTKGIKPCDREGYPGHWIVYFSSGTAPKLYNADGSQQLVEPGAIKTGYYVQVFGDIAGNDNAQKPGMYVNHKYVALSGYGKEISSGPAAGSVGFGGAALPPGASAVPVGGFAPAAPGVPAAPTGYPAPTPTPQAPAAYAPPVAPPPVVVTPNPAILAAPGVPVAPAAPLPPVAAVHQMTAAANNVPYESYVAQGWTDALLRQHGMML